MTNIRDRVLKSRSLPRPPTAAVGLIELLDADAGNSHVFVSAIENDPILTARVLQAANSTLFNIPFRISSLETAVSLIGEDAICSLTLSFSLFDESTLVDLSSDRYQWYWIKSLIQATTAERLAVLLDFESSNWAHYFCGLVMDIGALAMLKTIPDEYQAIFDECRHSGGCMTQIERDRLGISHDEIGAILLESWNIPESIVHAVRHHHSPAEEPSMGISDHLKTAALVSAVADYLIIGGLETLEIELGLQWEKLRRRRDEDLASFLTKTRFRVEKLSKLLGMESAHIPMATELTTTANGELAFAGVEREMDLTTHHSNQRQPHEQLESLQSTSPRDRLTNAFNRQYFDSSLELETKSAGRERRAIGVVFADIDNFRQINETHGQRFGDEVLVRVASAVQRNVRKTDIFARYGGEEFVVLVPRITCTELKELAERLRRVVANETFFSGGHRIPVTISIGYAIGIPQLPATSFGKTIVRAACEGMCISKQNGRNRATMRIGATGLGAEFETREEHSPSDLAPNATT